MAHSDVTLNVKSWCSCESECLHMSVDDRLIHGVSLSPGSLELGDQLLILRTSEIYEGETKESTDVDNLSPMMINELNLLVCPIVSIAIIDQDVKAVPLRPHVDEESDGVAHVDRSSNPVSCQTIAWPQLHEALWRCQSEHHGISGVCSGV